MLILDYVGFDFGTVYSSVCLWRDGKPLMVDMQGVTRVFSLVEASGRAKITFGRDTMLLCVCVVLGEKKLNLDRVKGHKIFYLDQN